MSTTEIYTLSLHDALPISAGGWRSIRRAITFCTTFHHGRQRSVLWRRLEFISTISFFRDRRQSVTTATDRKSTRLNSSHSQISYAVFCLKKKNIKQIHTSP